jgi:thymidylate kinase
MKKISLSHSAANKYEQCPAMYFYHYVERIRPIAKGSALFFGSALDEAFNVLLESKKEVITYDFDDSVSVLQHAYDEFDTQWCKQLENPNIEYFKSDIDLSLLLDIDHEALKEFDPEVGDYEAFISECFDLIKSKQTLCDEDQRLYNRIAWNSLYRKGMMMVEAYHDNILPQIHTVFDIQKKVELPDENENMLIGYIDAIVSFIDSPDRKVVLDNKSSSKAYPEDSVANSPQLGTYCEHEGSEWGAYAVVEKGIRKREPRTRTQLIIDKVSEKTIDETFEMYDNVLDGIENGEFEKNYDSGCYFFGRPCDYYAYCRSNGKVKKGLEEV